MVEHVCCLQRNRRGSLSTGDECLSSDYEEEDHVNVSNITGSLALRVSYVIREAHMTLWMFKSLSRGEYNTSCLYNLNLVNITSIIW